MALVKDHQEIQVIQNGTVSDFYQVHGMNIAQVGEELIQRAVANQNAALDSRSVPSPFGESIALVKNILNSNKAVSDEANLKTLIMYLRMSETAYTGDDISFHIRNFDESNSLDAPCIRDMKRLDGWKNDPDKVLYFRINNEVCGIFMPNHACFLPSAGFCEDIEKETKDNIGRTMIHGTTLEDFIAERPEIKNRCRALLETMIENGADNKILSPLLENLGGVLDKHEKEKYLAEPKEKISKEVSDYIKKTCPSIDPETACGYPGRNTEPRLLDTIALIHTGKEPIILGDTREICGEFVAIPPVQNTKCIADVSYIPGEAIYNELYETTMPIWIEFSARLDDRLYCKVYHMPNEGWKIRGPKNYIEMAHGIPEGILAKHDYLIKDPSTVLPLRGNKHEYECYWKALPDNSGGYTAELTSPQYEREKWEVIQRPSRIERLELWEKWNDHKELLGCVFPEPSPLFKKSLKTAYVAIDPAGAESVRLISVKNSRITNAVEFENLIYPITPVSKEEMDDIIEKQAPSADSKKTHFESLLQMFEMSDAGLSELWVKSRIWKMKEKEIFKTLIQHPEDMVSAMSNLGVIANPKEMIIRLQEKPTEKEKCQKALMHYIGILIMESILALSKDGYSISEENLEFLLSYPENSSDEGITVTMQKAIKGAIDLVNQNLTENNNLVLGRNVTQYSESEASAQWHKKNPPGKVFMGDSVPAGTPDYGYSTHDFSLRIQGKIYTFSLPYAAQYITNATLAKVYMDKAGASKLMRCFHEKKGKEKGQNYMKEAENALSKAISSCKDKLYENFGFILTLNQLFSNCTFCVNGSLSDNYQQQVQQIVEARLNIAIPAYADCIVRAILDGVLKPDKTVYLAPVGKGSLAINNVANGFESRFSVRLSDAINKQLCEDSCLEGDHPVFSGKIRLLPNNDSEKVSVAQGLIDLKEEESREIITEKISDEKRINHYLEVVYQTEGQKQEKERKQKELFSIMGKKARQSDFDERKKELYFNAFNSLMERYEYEDFTDSFECWGYIGTLNGKFDKEILTFAENDFENLKSELMETRRELIMSCLGRERELICGAMIDLIIERIPMDDLLYQ